MGRPFILRAGNGTRQSINYGSFGIAVVTTTSCGLIRWSEKTIALQIEKQWLK